MSKKHLKTVLLGAVAASAYLQGGLAHAQTARPAAPVADVGEVVVTARRREESLQSVPLSVTALSQDSLKAAGIVSATDLTFHVPGINLTTMASSSNTNFSIRGQTRAAVGAGLPAVVVYFNDVPEQANGSVFNPFDVQSVQVLKGPQGTLFGRNTIGGAILINTQPAGYEFGGYAQVTGGDYNRFDKEGAVNIPIVQDHLALRLAAQHVYRGATVKNGLGGKGFGGRDNFTGRATLRWDPTAGFSNNTVAEYGWGHEAPAVMIYATLPTGVFRGPFAALADCNTSVNCDLDLQLARQQAAGPGFTFSDVPPAAKTQTWTVSNTSVLHLTDDIELKNIAGYRHFYFNGQSNIDGQSLPFIQGDTIYRNNLMSDELQLSGQSFNDRLTWVVGAFYLRSVPDGRYGSFNQYLFNRTTAQRSYSFYHENSRAAFAQATYDLSALVPGLRVTGGYRYTVDKISGCGFNRNVNLPVANESDCRAAGGFRGNVRSAEPTWTYGLDYDIAQDVLGYVTVRRGYRGGGFNAPRLSTTAPRSLAAFQTFDPEILNDTEVGLKSTWNWNGMRGRFNIAYWHDKYSGVQLNQSVGVNFDLDNDASNDPQGGSVVINAGKAKLDGVDIDLSITPVEGLTLGATAAYMNARFTSVTRPAIFTAATAAPAYQNAPKWTYSFDVAYALPFIDPSLGEVVVGGNYYHRATFVLQNLTLPATGMGNLRVDWKGVYGSDFDLGLRVDNVGNTRDIVAAGISTSSLGQFSASYNDPRMVSVSLKYHF